MNRLKPDPGRKKKILLVDDHPITREGFAELINHEADLQVCGQAGNAAKAIHAVDQLHPDLAIIDISLEGSNGIELIKDIKSRHPAQLMLTLSMHDESLHGERALRAGAKGYIRKHEPTEEIMNAIREVLRGELYLSKKMRSIMLQKFVSGDSNENRLGVERLSDRELEVLQLIGNGRGTREIAEQLHLSIKTIETYRAHIKEKLELKSGMELVRFAVQWVTEQQDSPL